MAPMGHWRERLQHLLFIDRPASGQKTDPSHNIGLSFRVWAKRVETSSKEMEPVARILQNLWQDDSGQDIAEYAVMLAVILVIVVGTVRLIGSNANNVFSQVGSSIQ
jgi:Flp pilus assembly pilin Flp